MGRLKQQNHEFLSSTDVFGKKKSGDSLKSGLCNTAPTANPKSELWGFSLALSFFFFFWSEFFSHLIKTISDSTIRWRRRHRDHRAYCLHLCRVVTIGGFCPWAKWSAQVGTQEKGSDEPEFHITGHGSRKFRGLIPPICSIGSHGNQDYFPGCKPKGKKRSC